MTVYIVYSLLLFLFLLCQTARKPLESEHGDPFTLLNAFDEWIQVNSTTPVLTFVCVVIFSTPHSPSRTLMP